MHCGSQGSVDCFGLAHFITELQELFSLVFRHSVGYVLHDNFLVCHNLDVFPGKLRYGNPCLKLHIFVAASSTVYWATNIPVDLCALLAGGRDNRACSQNLNARCSHELVEALFG